MKTADATNQLLVIVWRIFFQGRIEGSRACQRLMGVYRARLFFYGTRNSTLLGATDGFRFGLIMGWVVLTDSSWMHWPSGSFRGLRTVQVSSTDGFTDPVLRLVVLGGEGGPSIENYRVFRAGFSGWFTELQVLDLNGDPAPSADLSTAPIIKVCPACFRCTGPLCQSKPALNTRA